MAKLKKMKAKHTESHEARQNGMTIPENGRGHGTVQPGEANKPQKSNNNETKGEREGWKVIASSKRQRLEKLTEHPTTVDDAIATVEAHSKDNDTIGEEPLNNEEVAAERTIITKIPDRCLASS